ncbi:drug/metabolite transporter (DMT)-like permease [Lactococcus lactis]|uniref:Drug/metabolite transporter (DMT)-like permease n=1 Tax=Lactococcus lactis TaxID=1358 RepID=A0AAW5TTR4_9LACT|nr:drug/metabolite transporter (DMT)-like permease [Lactococcus lactis]
MNVKKQIFKGTLYAVVAGCMWGISGIFGQLFFRDYHGSPLWITSTRLTIAGIILLAMSFSRDHKRFFDVWKSKKNMPTLFLYVFGGVFSVQYFYYVAIQLSNSATATILQYTAPVFIMLYLLIFQRQVPKPKSVLFVILAMIGVFFVDYGRKYQTFINQSPSPCNRTSRWCSCCYLLNHPSAIIR